MRFDPQFQPRDYGLRGLEAVTYGGDYNPEQWPRHVWREDVRLMREAGVNLVSIGIWSWALLEPEPGRFDFEWLDELIELLWANEIHVDLATPTAAPPAWFYANNPDARVVTRDGTVLTNASRGMASPSAPAYRQACASITEALAKRYGDHPAVALWHVHNEYGAPVSDSYDEYSVAAWRVWLQRRYTTLDAVNEAWGTTFWGQTYTQWEHIPAPAVSATVTNPSMRLDYQRFTSDALLECFIAERDIIRQYSTAPVTTNFMASSCPAMDLWAWAQECDVISNDHYLTASDPNNHITLAMDADLTRSLARGLPWILMEHSTSAVNWQERNVAKAPGEMTRNALSHLGRGANGIMFFQWRAARFGAEKFHSAMIPHGGTNTRVFREVCSLGATLGDLTSQGITASTTRAQVAILWDWESMWAQDLEWRPSVDVDHRERTVAFYQQLFHDRFTVDFVHPEAALDQYALVIAPASYLLTDAAAANIDAYVRGGGRFVASFFTGVVDDNDTVRHGGLAAALAPVLGVTVEEFLPLRAGETLTVHGDQLAPGLTLTGDVWADDLVLDGAKDVASYVDGPAPGGPAITRHEYGQGVAWYVSTRLCGDSLRAVLDAVYKDAGLTPERDVPHGLEIVVRTSDTGATFVTAMNHTDTDAGFPPVGGHGTLQGVDLRGGRIVTPPVVARTHTTPTPTDAPVAVSTVSDTIMVPARGSVVVVK
ncbi:beta-galactosidase [Jonesia denitrificans]|uniref:Beta-galactosidase n=1 Tax=Jonesia denitrificans (strain ATCC 14870 / DSM 20603 / BCRC 15368 / CIP 55.134 / JCM 11481 / NBRC 15587 / NCTC 10816 / Prevot 55134) TaxID=471856 RepID=C7QZ75_JONDD|nr:beta-galactosidase [Jonesia denitrificans]ACV07983.1 Beta-galactosidase [Jonesia denitrificans DSM 20603]ASE08326.1 beta-galactosidase [Jonesia denitrificans]QXB42925.1 beta-galactosidase [Jonesia denitrificans]SQH19958.1 Beta-galactosidase [Jonesia denitrificans]